MVRSFPPFETVASIRVKMASSAAGFLVFPFAGDDTVAAAAGGSSPSPGEEEDGGGGGGRAGEGVGIGPRKQCERLSENCGEACKAK